MASWSGACVDAMVLILVDIGDLIFVPVAGVEGLVLGKLGVEGNDMLVRDLLCV